jgi:serine phosphatase RsbU (regulator of sigma subunit)
MRAVGWSGDVGAEWNQFRSDVVTPSTVAHRTGEPVFVQDLEDARSRFPAIAGTLERIGGGPAAALPLVSAGVRLGAWSLAFPAGRLLHDGDRRFLVTAGAMVAQALLRARLLDVEQRAMAQLQRSLLPRHLETVPGLEVAVRYAAGDAAVEVGGDWYDVVILAQGAVGLVMGDVEGHDVEAAACMGLVRSAVRAYAAEGHPPAIVLELANRFVAEVGLGRMVTLVYASLHPGERLITTVSAGHLPLQCVAPDGRHREVPTDVGPPLGVHPDGALWPETTSTLPPHALLTALTDGLVETREDDLSVGLARLRDALVEHRAKSTEEVADALLASRSSRSGDDVALLVARLTGKPAQEQRSSRRLPPTSASVFLARRSARQVLREWGVEPGVVDVAELVVSELASNAARQSEDPIDVVLALPGPYLRIEVADTSHRMPALPAEEVDADATSGRGLLLVDALASRWGVHSDGLAKRVWAELDLP